jgi:hypothetical protein
MNKSLKILLAVNSIFVLAGNLLGPLYAVFIEGLGGSIAVVSGTWSVMLLTTTLVNFFLIRYGDRVKEHEYFLIVGFVFRAIAWIGLSTLTVYQLLFFCKSLLDWAKQLVVLGLMLSWQNISTGRVIFVIMLSGKLFPICSLIGHLNWRLYSYLVRV